MSEPSSEQDELLAEQVGFANETTKALVTLVQRVKELEQRVARLEKTVR
jgi:hypothetical protein